MKGVKKKLPALRPSFSRASKKNAQDDVPPEPPIEVLDTARTFVCYIQDVDDPTGSSDTFRTFVDDKLVDSSDELGANFTFNNSFLDSVSAKGTNGYELPQDDGFNIPGFEDPPPNPSSRPFRPKLFHTTSQPSLGKPAGVETTLTMHQPFYAKNELPSRDDWKQHTHLRISPSNRDVGNKAASCPGFGTEEQLSPGTEYQMWRASQFDVEADIQEEVNNITSWERDGDDRVNGNENHAGGRDKLPRMSSIEEGRQTTASESKALGHDLPPGDDIRIQRIQGARQDSLRILEETRAKKMRLKSIKKRRESFHDSERQRLATTRSDTAMLAIEQAKLEDLTTGYLTRTSSLLRNPFDPDNNLYEDPEGNGGAAGGGYSNKALQIKPDWTSIAPALPPQTLVRRRSSLGEFGSRPKADEGGSFAPAPALK